jgi:PAS domain S-box-containing protein
MVMTTATLEPSYGPWQAKAALFDEAPFMMHSIDANGRLLDANRRWLDIMGYERDEVISKPSTLFLTEESVARALRDTLPLFWSTGSARSVGYQFVTRDGQILEALLDAELIPRDSGQPIGIAIIRVGKDLQDWRLARSILAAAKSLMTTWHQLGSAASLPAPEDDREASEPWRSASLGNELIRPVRHRGGLTLREFEVLRLLSLGLRNKEIANELGIGIRAVKFHAENLYSKLGAHTRGRAVRVAIDRGLLDDSSDQPLN